jgi:hypothetical protein
MTDIVTVITKRATYPGNIFVISDHTAALTASGEVLALAETEGAGMSDRTHFAPFILTAMRLSTILNYYQIVFAGDVHDGLHIAYLAVEMDRDYGPGPGRYLALDIQRIDGVIFLSDIGKYRNSTCLQYTEAGGDKGIRRDDDLVAGAYTQPGQCRV